MIEEFNKSALSRVINYNEPMAEALADNLYEKIRQSGILAEYIERNKEVRTKVNAIDASTEAPVFRADSRFTFGYCYCGTRLISPTE
jgi:hypothetical protein